MASNDDALDAYTTGVKDAIELINENEGTKHSWTDVLSALRIRVMFEGMFEEEGE